MSRTNSEISSLIVRGEEHLPEARQPELERAVLVDLLQHLEPLLGRAVGPGVRPLVLETGERVRDRRLQLVEPGLVRRLLLRTVVRALHRQRVLRGAGEHGEVADLVGDRLDHLDAGGADADDAHALAREVDAACGPLRGVQDRAAEAVLALEGVLHRGGEHARAAHEELGVDDVAGVGGDRPAAAVLVEVGAGDGGGELDVLAQVEPVGDVVQPLLDLGLAGELLAPAPVLVELLVEVVLVDVGLAVEARPGVAVPPPGAAHVARLVDRAHPQPLLAELVELVQPGDPGAQDDGVQLFGG